MIATLLGAVLVALGFAYGQGPEAAAFGLIGSAAILSGAVSSIVALRLGRRP